MFTREQIWRAFQTVAVPVLLGLIVRQVWPDQVEETPKSLYLPLLADIDFVPRKLPATYRKDDPEFDEYARISVLQDVLPLQTPNVTAVILNWSRFPNVLLIASLLCGPWLQGTISEVFIWNNSPRKITYDDLKNTGCPQSRLHIQNSPVNSLFQGRYIACAQVSTPYCFIQDDDYLIRPEIIQSLQVRMSDPLASRAIHLLPPHEHLSTTLREVHVPGVGIQTSFAWLGHGTMLRRSEAQRFLTLLRRMDVPPDEMQMADNFFTILSNQVPEVWFDQSFELGGGQPFTVGSEGDERNKQYILRAAGYLESIARCGRTSCAEISNEQSLPALPYVKFSETPPPKPWTQAACRGSACVLKTNIDTLPKGISHIATNASELLALEVKNAQALGDTGKQNYLDYAPSNAVDAKPISIFRSLTDATKGDTVILDMLADISESREWNAVELVLLVDSATESTLDACSFGWSSDNVNWHPVSHRPICYTTTLKGTVDGVEVPLQECSVQVHLASNELHLRATGRYFRVQLEEDKEERWMISEIWLRGV